MRYYNPKWLDAAHATMPIDLSYLRDTFVKAVEKRMMADVPYGVLLSGGLDSSLVASVIAGSSAEVPADGQGGGPRAGQVVLDRSGGLARPQGRPACRRLHRTEHYGFTFTVEEGINAISDVIYHLETYDVTTIRAGTPMFLLARKIKAMGVKMVMSGEGADETLGGYLYFHKAPNGTELHEESASARLTTCTCTTACVRTRRRWRTASRRAFPSLTRICSTR